MLKLSTGLRTKLLDTASLSSLLDLGVIKIYSGTKPDSADEAYNINGAALLCTVTVNATPTGLSFDSAADGVISKPSAVLWRGQNVDTGVATFYRHVAVGDDGTESTTQARLQGDISLAGAAMNLTTTTFTISEYFVVDTYSVALPTL